jgi:hypothetical protein
VTYESSFYLSNFFIFYFWDSKSLGGTLETVTRELFTIAWQSQPNLNPWSFLLLYFFEKRFSGQSFAILLNVEWVSWPIFGCGECINFYEFFNSQIMFLFYPSFFYFCLCIKTLECVFRNFSSSNLEKVWKTHSKNFQGQKNFEKCITKYLFKAKK